MHLLVDVTIKYSGDALKFGLAVPEHSTLKNVLEQIGKAGHTATILRDGVKLSTEENIEVQSKDIINVRMRGKR